jgi:hypothetical protein
MNRIKKWMMEHLEMPFSWLFHILLEPEMVDLPLECCRFKVLLRSYASISPHLQPSSFVVPILLVDSPYIPILRRIAHLARSQTMSSPLNPDIVHVDIIQHKGFETFGINKMGMCFIDWEPSVAQPQFVLLPNQRWQDL